MVGLTKHGQRELLLVQVQVNMILGDHKFCRFTERTKPALLLYLRDFTRTPTYDRMTKLSEMCMTACPVKNGHFIPDAIDKLVRHMDYVSGFQTMDEAGAMENEGGPPCPALPWED